MLEILENANFWKNEKKVTNYPLTEAAHSTLIFYLIQCKISRNLLLVLLHDLLFRQRGIQAPDGPIKETVMTHRARFKAELAKLRLSRGALSNSDLIEDSTKDQGKNLSSPRVSLLLRLVPIPRYVRVNTILTTTEAVIAAFSKEGYKHVAAADIDWRWVYFLETLLTSPLAIKRLAGYRAMLTSMTFYCCRPEQIFTAIRL